MKRLLCILLVFPLNLIFAKALDGFFAKFPNQYLVETGTHCGHGVAQALNAGYSEIRSIELSTMLYNMCCDRFKEEKKVKLYQGDSGKALHSVIADIQVPITFWLDGHYSGNETAKGATNSPILQELQQIKNHPIKTHTILIDDVRDMGTKNFDYVTLKEINIVY